MIIENEYNFCIDCSEESPIDIVRDDLENKIDTFWDILEESPNERSEETQALVNDIISTSKNIIDHEDSIIDDQFNHFKFYLNLIDSFPKQKDLIHSVEFLFINTAGVDWTILLEDSRCPESHINAYLNTASKDKIRNALFDIPDMADNLLKNKKYDRAIMFYESIGSDIKYTSTWNNWACCYAEQNKFSDAITVLKNGIEKFNDTEENQLLICNMALYYHKSKQSNLAIDILNTFIKDMATIRYKYNKNYIYALELKATIYHENDLALYSLIEYSQLTTMGSLTSDQMINIDATTQLVAESK